MKYFFAVLVFITSMQSVFAFEPFEVKDIKLEGLQRISIGTVFNYLPIKPGDKIDNAAVRNSIHVLYKTGFFKDIHFEREGDILVIFVAERSAINNIKIEGNSEISKDQLDDALKQIGLIKGRVFNRSILEGLEKELQRQYYSLGKYNIKIDVNQTQLERNRVDINIKISEGESAEIYSVNIVGNKKFSDKKLNEQFTLAEPSFWGGRNNYKKQQLAADLETLKSFYLDRGFIDFKINSTQVSLGPEKESVYITVNIKEGERYTVREVKLAGDLILSRDKFEKLIMVKSGDIFSRRKVVDTTKAISDLLAENGYAFANVNMVPDIDKDSRTIGLTFFVDPGRRIYVRKVNISGNTKTQDKVIRRELRQIEGDWLSTKHVARSKTRLDRLGFFSTVNVQTVRIPGSTDQVDLNYSVVEKPTGSLQAGLGYSDTQGPVVNLAVTQDNFLGTGQRVGVNLDNSSVTKQYSFNLNNPYYTEDGVSRNISFTYRKVDAAAAAISNYTTDSYGASLSYGVPLSEYTNYNWGMKFDDTTITTGSGTSQNIVDFVNRNGKSNSTYQFFTGWSYDSRNRRIFANKGSLTSLGAEIAVPGGDLEYYKVDLRHVNYFPLGYDITLAANVNLGYGASFKDSLDYPPYKNYFAGGSTSIRGYDANSVGPRDSVTNNPIGGSVKILGNVDLILPNPFAENSSSTRVSLFVDAGSVFRNADTVSTEEFRYTAGIAFIWITPVGAMRFNFAEALNKQPGDSTRSFQFSLGSPF
ncbi:MAG TPA: outer membrane protein assembly factor BamA [Gammaproteobacteria bacterium]|nr:outer membrane protein assembly factor BamA [Gammaproteobacteria bacterium]